MCYLFYLDSNNFICARSFLTFANFELDFLAVVQCCVSATCLNFRVVNKQVFTAVFRCNKTETLVSVKPLYSTLSHDLLLVFICVELRSYTITLQRDR